MFISECKKVILSARHRLAFLAAYSHPIVIHDHNELVYVTSSFFGSSCSIVHNRSFGRCLYGSSQMGHLESLLNSGIYAITFLYRWVFWTFRGSVSSGVPCGGAFRISRASPRSNVKASSGCLVASIVSVFGEITGPYFRACQVCTDWRPGAFRTSLSFVSTDCLSVLGDLGFCLHW